MKTFDDFTNLFRRPITLGFKLEPVTIVQGHIITLQESPYKKYIQDDEKLQDTYLRLKPAIDAYHRYYIDCGLRNLLSLSNKEKAKKNFMGIIEKLNDSQDIKNEDKLKKYVVSSLTDGNIEKFDDLSKEIFLSKILKNFVERGNSVSSFFENDKDIFEAQKILREKDSKLFSNCVGLLEARTLLYGTEGKSVSVAHRCISVNLPKFIQNGKVFEKCVNAGALDIEKLNKDFKTQLDELSHLCGNTINSVEQMFNLSLYPCYMVQQGIEILNTIIGRDKKDKSSAVGINQKINEYNQRVKSGKKKDKEESRKTLPLLRPLFDQILFGKGLYIPQLQNIEEVRPLVERTLSTLHDVHAFDGFTESNQIYSLFQSLSQYRADGIFISAKSVSSISNSLFGDWNILAGAVKRDKNDKVLQKSISLKALDDYISALKIDDSPSVNSYFENARVSDVSNDNAQVKLFSMLKDVYEKYILSTALHGDFLDNDQLFLMEQLMDGIMSLRRFVSVFMVGIYEDSADGAFYKRYMEIMDRMQQVEYDYNLIRNYFRRKPFNQKKVKLHFGKSDLLGNWPEQEGKGTKGCAYIFRVSHQGNPDDEYDYYLGIGNTSMFSGKGEERQDRDAYRQNLKDSNDLSLLERYYYYQVPLKTFKGQYYNKANQNYASKMDKPLVDYVCGEIKKSNNENVIEKLSKLDIQKTDAISILKWTKKNIPEVLSCIMESPDFQQKYTEMLERWRKAFELVKRIPIAQKYAEQGFRSFEELDNAIKDIDTVKIVDFIPVSQKELEEALAEKVDGKENKRRLFLFRITNKDLSYAQTMVADPNGGEPRRKSRGRENLHTMYFRALMDKEQTSFDIGKGEIFFRKATDKKIAKYDKDNPTHPAGQPISCRRRKGESRVFSYDLIKDKHYLQDTYLFHLSIFQNYNPQMIGGLNANVREYLVQEHSREPLHVIGIDRGERNLLYMVMLDETGKIKCQRSFNALEYEGVDAKGKFFRFETDFRALLMDKADQLKKQQKRWQVMDNIKDLKKGYLSLVVHELAKLMIENHAIIVMEDLNQGFFSTRQKQLANVYQEFESMLEAKLSFIVKDKNQDYNTPGGLYKAYQLAQENVNGNQNGFIFYVPAWMTSKIDPLTGFVNLFTFSYTNREKAASFLKEFNYIKKNEQTGDYDFCFRYKNFSKLKMTQKVTAPDVEWVSSSHGSRISRRKTPHGYESHKIDNLTQLFTELFEEKGIRKNGDIKQQIIERNDADLYEKFFHLFKLMMQMRNSNEREDFIVSPIRDPQTGVFYYSENYRESQELPADADANGAYNIARKGLMALAQIKQGADKFSVLNEMWLSEAQKSMIVKND